MNKMRSFSMKPKLLLLLMVLGVGCNLPFGARRDQSNNIEVVIPESEMRLSRFPEWMLSPEGDKIYYYSSSEKGVLLTPVTGEKNEIDRKCFTWLDNTSLACVETVVFIYDDISEIPLLVQRNGVSEVKNWTETLRNARKIYLLERENSILVLSADPDKNYLIDCSDVVLRCDDLDIVLEGYNTYVTIPRHSYGEYHGRIYSPNGSYYYRYERKNGRPVLTIYDALYDTELAGRGRGVRGIWLGGWAADSSGVYFQEYDKDYYDTHIVDTEAVNKLKVPR